MSYYPRFQTRTQIEVEEKNLEHVKRQKNAYNFMTKMIIIEGKMKKNYNSIISHHTQLPNPQMDKNIEFH